MVVLKKYYVTLIELLMVIALMIMMAGIIGVNVRKLITEQRFDTEVSLIVDELRLAQNLMLILNYDIHVKFEPAKEGKGIKFWIETSKLLNDNWTKELIRPRPLLTAIKRIEFGEGASPIDIAFYSKGSSMSQGIIILSNSARPNDSNALTSYICLPGFPSQIASVSKPLDNKECNSKNETEYDEKLTTLIQREIAQKKPVEFKK